MGQRAASRYAQALISLAQEEKSMDKILEQTTAIEKSLNESNDLRSVLNSPVIKNDDKLNIVKSVFKSFDPMLLNMFNILSENNRFDHLRSICESYAHLYNDIHNIQEAHITSSIKLDDAQLKVLKAKIKSMTGNEAKVTTSVNKDLLGGFILRLNDLQYDASISGQLNKLKRNFYN